MHIFKIDNFIANVIMKKVLKEQYGFTRLAFKTKAQEKESGKYFDVSVPNRQLEDYELYRNGCVWHDEANKVAVYPCEYFCPTWAVFKNKAFTDNTIAIHWNQSTWWDSKKINMLKNSKYSIEHLIFVDKLESKLQKIFSIKNSLDGNYKIITVLGIKIKTKRKHRA